MKTALLIIATGEKYHAFVPQLLESAQEFFVEHDAIVWTDTLEAASTFDAKFVLIKEALGFPKETLYRYHTILQQDWQLKKYDQVFYIDSDMRFVAPVGEEIFSNGITATLHPGYVGSCGTPERRIHSAASITPGSVNKYFCGGFNGGATSTFLRMATDLAYHISVDESCGVLAVWHDESHLNRYLHEHPPCTVLDPSYCYPENASEYYTNKWKAAGLNVTPKILALDKGKR